MNFAYLDAGSGSLILQAILGGIAGVVVAGKAWKARFFNKEDDGEKADMADEQTALTEQ